MQNTVLDYLNNYIMNNYNQFISAILFLLFFVTSTSAQTKLKLGEQEFELQNVTGSIIKFQGENVLKIERDLKALPFDEKNVESSVDQPTFAKLLNFEMENGIIEVKMLSQIMANSPFPAARGFIGVAFRIDSLNNRFEGLYLRPSNGRADDQLRRNHTIQYFSYPEYNFGRLRREANGLYETYSDIGLNEWIDVKIVINDKKLTLFINNQKTPSFIVNEMLGKINKGGIGLWVEIGTIGFFKDLKIQKL